MNGSTFLLPTPLVDVHWLNDHLDDPQVVVIDCRFALNDPHQGHREYLEGHIPGAMFLDLDQDLSGPVQHHGGRHPLPNLDDFMQILKGLGIASEPATQVVAYDSTKGAFASRMWWLLQFIGHGAIAVLDGGFQAWVAANYPLETEQPQPIARGPLRPHLRRDWVVSREEILETQKDPNKEVLLVDARSPERFRGEYEPIDPVAGAIPGSVNVFWQHNLDENGFFRTSEELNALWHQLPPTQEQIFYCGSGVTACMNLLAQAVMNKPLPKLYVGGWSDWCSYESSP